MALTHVVVGTNGTRASGYAVRWAAEVAERLGGALVIVLVIDQTEWWRLSDEDPATLARAEREVRLTHPHLAVETRLVAGEPVAQLLRASASAQLLVIGTDRNGRPSPSASFGTVSARASAAASCPLVVVPAGARFDLDQVVTGLDDDDQAEDVLALAMDTTRWSAGELTIVHAWAPLPPFRAAEIPQEQHPPAALSARLTEIIEHTYEHNDDLPDLELRVRLIAGGVVSVLTEQARGAGLLVIGTHGRATLSSLVLGSVCRALLSQMPCPVLIVPQAAHGARLTARHRAAAAAPGSAREGRAAPNG